MNDPSARASAAGRLHAADARDHAVEASGVHRPGLIIFDVNETLSDMSGLADRFADVGLPHQVATTWFAGLLLDGFALTVTGENPEFAQVASESLRGLLHTHDVPDVEGGLELIMDAFLELPPHPDVVEAVELLSDVGIRLVTLSNGATAVAETLLRRSGVRDRFERLLSVHDAPAWKPAATAYRYALDVCHAEDHDSMLVAVHPWDVHGAHRAGLRTAFINRAGGRYPSFFAQPDVQARSLVQLANVLAGEPGP
jgi:2-haloacid dehalogenase